MIALTNQKLLIFTPPKTASTSMHHALSQMKGAIWIMSDEPGVEKHTTTIPAMFENYQRIVVVRNPYQRFLSLWGHHQKDCLEAGRDFGTIERHAVKVAAREHWFLENISERYGSLGCENYWQIEHIRDAFDRYKIPIWLPEMNRNTFARQKMTDKLYDILRDWGNPDAIAYGYPTA
jgi:hypothetical protein